MHIRTEWRFGDVRVPALLSSLKVFRGSGKAISLGLAFLEALDASLVHGEKTSQQPSSGSGQEAQATADSEWPCLDNMGYLCVSRV